MTGKFITLYESMGEWCSRLHNGGFLVESSNTSEGVILYSMACGFETDRVAVSINLGTSEIDGSTPEFSIGVKNKETGDLHMVDSMYSSHLVVGNLLDKDGMANLVKQQVGSLNWGCDFPVSEPYDFSNVMALLDETNADNRLYKFEVYGVADNEVSVNFHYLTRNDILLSELYATLSDATTVDDLVLRTKAVLDHEVILANSKSLEGSLALLLK